MAPVVVHRLGMAPPSVPGWPPPPIFCAAILCAAAAALALPVSAAVRARAARRRREALLGAARQAGSGRPARRPGPRGAALPVLRCCALPAGAAVAVAVLLGGPLGWLSGVAAGCVTARLRAAARRRPLPAATALAERQLPAAAELLTACLAAGAVPGAAADAVGRTLGGPLGAALRRVAAEIRLGGDPVRCWAALAELPGADDLGRWMARASTTGVPPVAAVARLAAAHRAERARAAARRARRAAVLATGPLGLCFLPAFVALGVVPVVIGLAEAMARTR